MKYSIDSNVFRDLNFLKSAINTNHEFVISSIVQLEQNFYAMVKQNTPKWRRIQNELRLKTIPILKSDAISASTYAFNFLKHPKGPSHFFRDCLIAASSTRINAILVTRNIHDFEYLPSSMVIKPHEVEF